MLSSFGSDVLFPSDEEIRSRFLTSAVPAIAERADAIVAVVDKLEAVADIRELTGLLSSAEERS
jgi:hypothetical protein